jgi:signal transduction histidine kinase
MTPGTLSTDAGTGGRRSAERERQLAAATAAVGLVFALSAVTMYWWTFPIGRALDIPLQGFGVVWIVTGYLAWTRLPGPRIGLIIVCLGATYYLQDLRASHNVVIFGVGYCLDFLWLAVGAHLILAYPEGRVKGRLSQVLLTCCYAAAIITQSVQIIVDRIPPPMGYDKLYPSTLASKTGSVLAIVFLIALAAVVVRRWRRASTVGRRSRAPVWIAIMLLVIPGTAACLASFFNRSLSLQNDLNSVALGIAVLLLPAILMVQSTNAKRALLRLTGVLDPVQVQILKRHPEALQQMLADAVGDPSLTVAYPIGGERYVNIEGQPVSPAFTAVGRTITRVMQGDDVVAVIEHDEAVDDQHQVTEITATVTGVAIDIAGVHAKLRGKIKEINKSRLRISEAALEERRRIGHDIHDGAQQRFLAVLALLGLAQEKLGEDYQDGIRIGAAQGLVTRAHGQLQDAIEELRKLAQGIYPASLSEAGLAAAIHDIADTSPVPIWVEIPRTRWGEGTETTSYFLIAEAITNATKHAKATHIEVRAREQDEHIHIDVFDDGQGGMEAAPKGLADRASTVGGRLTFCSPPGMGTVIRAVLPL